MDLVMGVEVSNEKPRYTRARPIGRCWRREDGTYAYELLRKSTSGAFVVLERYGTFEVPPPASPPATQYHEHHGNTPLAILHRRHEICRRIPNDRG